MVHPHAACCPLHGCVLIDPDCPQKTRTWVQPCEHCVARGLKTPADLHRFRFPEPKPRCPHCQGELP